MKKEREYNQPQIPDINQEASLHQQKLKEKKKRKAPYLDMTNLDKYPQNKFIWQKTVRRIQGEDLKEEEKRKMKAFKIVDTSELFNALKKVKYVQGEKYITEGRGIVVENLDGKQYKIGLDGEITESEIIYSGEPYPRGWEPYEKKEEVKKIQKEENKVKEGYVRHHFDEYQMIIERSAACGHCDNSAEVWRMYWITTPTEKRAKANTLSIHEELQCGNCGSIFGSGGKRVKKENVGYYQIKEEDFDFYYNPKISLDDSNKE